MSLMLRLTPGVAALALACGPATSSQTMKPAEEAEPGTSSAEPAAVDWWKQSNPCPAGASVTGAAPPQGTTIGCENLVV
ncbi:MAG: hypothetical protein R3B13_06665 [Polyangiaceae bacterium]